MTDGVVSLNTGDGAGINRFWRYLNEYNESFKFDVKHQLNDNMSIKTGGFAMFKHRDFEIVNFKIIFVYIYIYPETGLHFPFFYLNMKLKLFNKFLSILI